MTEDRKLIVGSTNPSVVAGSKCFPCTECEVPVALSPSGQRMREQRDLEPMCESCANRVATEADELNVVLPTAEQLVEAMQAIAANRGCWN